MLKEAPEQIKPFSEQEMQIKDEKHSENEDTEYDKKCENNAEFLVKKEDDDDEEEEEEVDEINPALFLSIRMKEGSTERELLECSSCARMFSSRPHLSAHIRSVHNKEKPYRCGECGASFGHRSTLAAHSRGHVGERPHSCGVCHRRFAKRSNLRVHLVTHSQVKPYVCAVCGKTFARPANLAEHTRVHTGERAHVCPVCQKAFSSRSVLNRHERLHLSVECAFCCDYCDKRFSRFSYLEEHTRIHTGERRYACKTCGQTFMHRGQVFRHKQAHTMQDDNDISHLAANAESLSHAHTLKEKEEIIAQQDALMFSEDEDDNFTLQEEDQNSPLDMRIGNMN